MNKKIIVISVVIIAILGFFLFFKESKAPVVNKNTQTPVQTTTTKPKVNGVQVEAGAKMETGTP
jgi:hypothetical protein